MSLIPAHKEVTLQGTAVSPGLAFGPAHIISRGLQAPETYDIPESSVESEVARFRSALETTKKQITGLQQHIAGITDDSESQIFDAHIMLLDDRSMISKVENEIKGRLLNAEFCFFAVIQNYSEAMRRLNDAYLSERAADIDDIAQRVLHNFSHASSLELQETRPEHHHIVIAHDLAPSDTATMDPDQSVGFVTEIGSINSHTAILARSLGIPAIVGLPDLIIEIQEASDLILNGYTGELIINPTVDTQRRYRAIAEEKAATEEELNKLRDEQTTTLDGRPLILSANAEFKHEFPHILESGAEGIGLFRTEFFLLGDGEIPTEEAQYQLYAEAAKITKPHRAIIRTLDAGGDKLPLEPLAEPEPNPFLGWRGIRVSLSRVDMFKEQLRAILRASVHGKVGVMFPLVSAISELEEAIAIFKECMNELDQKGIAYDPNIELGVMIEVPSAAIMAHEIAQEVDFLSIGTNDLIQYTVAVDRVNPHVSGLYKPSNPAVIRLIKMTIDASNNNDSWTSICGEMASDLRLIPLLVGLGVDKLSVGAHQLPRIKKAICSLKYSECQELAEAALKLKRGDDILEISLKLAKASYPDLLD
ncbi:phosphoenolpyruvate--protein phosphotransferase [Rubritalea marina]|uniref:phosphoenolpyruvate--protein phosphotransferase n=1 Tax=Rubritalea marina TaxID=361055 RepID=UPI00036E53D2|nr:phosphoenolpyruvate--protein phosphotransferase [Rubritalea marina]